MALINSFRDLDVYKAAVEQAHLIFTMTRHFPAEERYSLTDQVRRSSRAVGAMIAEAWAKRRYQAAFVSKLTEALAETMETQGWLDHSLRCSYIAEADFRKQDAKWQSIGAMISRMIQRADDFCQPREV